MTIRAPKLYEEVFCPYCQREALRVNPARLRWERERRMLSRPQVEKALGMSENFIYKVENGRRRASEKLIAFYDLCVQSGTAARPRKARA